MNIKDTLGKLSEALGVELLPWGETKEVPMTPNEFMTHAVAEVAKAAKEEPEIAKRRLDLLRKNVQTLAAHIAKASWEDTERVSVSVFVDPGQVDTTEQEGKMTVPQPEASIASNEGQTLGKALDALAKTLADLNPKAGATAATATTPETPPAFAWPQDINAKTIEKSDDGWGGDPWSATPGAR